MPNKQVINTWVKLYNRGISINKISELYKIKTETITKHLIDVGVIKKEPKTPKVKECVKTPKLIKVKECVKTPKLRKNGVTPEEVKLWCDLYSTMSISEIARKSNRSMYTISKHLISENVHTSRWVTEKLAKKWVYLYLIKDLSTPQIGRKYKYHPDVVRRHLLQFGVKPHWNIETREIINYERFKKLYDKYKFNRKEK